MPDTPQVSLKPARVSSKRALCLMIWRRGPYKPSLIEKITDAAEPVIKLLGKYDSPNLFLGYESLEFEFGAAREHVACGLGWEHGSTDGCAETFRSHAPGLSQRAKRLAEQARALVVSGGLSWTEGVALLLETALAVAQARPMPSFKSRQHLSPRWPEGRCERP
jgi:hypothetical protein